jgi:hypothetical protein
MVSPLPGPIFKSPLFRAESFKVTTVYTNVPFIWPKLNLTPESLVSSGFYCLRKADKVQCAFCNLIVSEWGKAVVPFTVHVIRSPRCPFLLGTVTNEETQKEIDLCELAVSSLTIQDISITSSHLESYKSRRLFAIAAYLDKKLQKKKAKTICKLCESEKINSLVLPCCHSFCCTPCAYITSTCLICDQLIVGRIEIIATSENVV